MKRLTLLLILPFLTGCASFAHGIVAEKEAVLASFDDVQRRADEAYGLTVGAPLSVVLASARFGVVVTLAGMSGVAHIPSGIVGCSFCDAEMQRATSRPLK